MNFKILRTKILITLVVISIFLFSSIEIYHYNNNNSLLYKESIEKLLILTQTMRSFHKVQTQLYKSRLKQMQENQKFANALRVDDKTTIKTEFHKYSLRFFRESKNLEHIHLYNTQGHFIDAIDSLHKNIVDKHKIVYNQVLQELLKKQKFIKGYVKTSNNIYYASICSPLLYKGKVIAYIEFGLKADNLFKLASRVAKYKYALYINTQDQTAQKRKIGTLFTSNSPIFQELHITQKFIYKYANENSIFSYKGKQYFFQQYDVETPFQKNFAEVVLALDVSQYIRDRNENLLFTFKLYLIILLIVLSLIYFILTKLINKLYEEEKELLVKQEQFKIVLDNSNNFITLFQNEKLILVNETLLSFFSYKNKEAEFLKEYAQLNKLFEPSADTFSLPNSQNNLKWIHKLETLDENSKIVAMRHQSLGLYYYSVKITTIPHQQNSHIVIFSDITAIFNKAKKDEYLAYHDTLTNIYNRQYFNEHIQKNIQNARTTEAPSSLLMIDIDFFKRVNDSYGHQVGDDVLVLFAKTLSEHIRAYDILARWGGEEFVILLNNTNEEQAHKIAEMLRQKIEQVTFVKVGKLTCSIGLSQFQNGDSPSSWFAKIDKALYLAKESGRNRVEIH